MAWTHRARHDRPVYISRTALPRAVGQPVMEIVALREAREEGLRLLEEYEETADASARPGLSAVLPGLREAVREGRCDGAVWIGPKDDGVALAVWRTSPEVGRRISHLYLSLGHQNPGALARFLALLEEAPPGPKAPIAALPEAVPGLSPSSLADLLTPRGFRRYLRVAMRRPVLPLPPPPSPPSPRSGSPRSPLPCRLEGAPGADNDALLSLYMEAFEKSNDRLWVDSGDLQGDGEELLEGLVREVWGPWVREASFVGRDESGGLLGASLVTHPPSRCPLLIGLFVKPGAQGRGLGRALLVATLGSLGSMGERELELNVIRENASAFQLYSSLGFETVSGTESAFWARDLPGR